jgi:hypothetical protein
MSKRVDLNRLEALARAAMVRRRPPMTFPTRSI